MEQNQNSIFERINNTVRTSVSIKLLSIGVLIAVLLIPNSMIKSLISERSLNQFAATKEVSEKWGSPVEVTGPIVTIPFWRQDYTKDQGITRSKHFAHFLPTSLVAIGNISPNTRKRGIYEVIVYNTKIEVSGAFEAFDFSNFQVLKENILWSEAFVSIGIPDMTGIQSDIHINFGKDTFRMGPGIPVQQVLRSGVNAKVALDATPSQVPTPFSFILDINGTKSLLFNPIGKSTQVKLTSSWPHPSFTGQFLPDNYELTDNGFTAEWSVFDLNRNYPQQWQGAAHQIAESGFGVSLYQPVDNYQRNTRSAKYAVLILFLTFFTFFFVEILNKKRIHPVQYILIGLALTIFYSLLLSLSEIVGFNFAYAIASTIIVCMITLYAKAILRSIKLALVLFAFFTMIYSFIFVILQLEDFALLVGSIGLVAILGTCMYLSRKVDWFNVKPNERISHATS